MIGGGITLESGFLEIEVLLISSKINTKKDKARMINQSKPDKGVVSNNAFRAGMYNIPKWVTMIAIIDSTKNRFFQKPILWIGSFER